MPLEKGKSEKAFSHNVAAEMHAGKPQKQALAIAYATKRRAQKKKMAMGGCYAEGGQIKDNYQSPDAGPDQDEFMDLDSVDEQKSGFVKHEGDVVRPNHMAMEEDDRKLNEHGEEEQGPYGAYADGGFIEDNKQDEAHMLDMVGRIMKQRQMHYSKGGQVANDVGVAAAGKLPAEYDDLVKRASDMEDADYTGANSGDEIGNEHEDARSRDIVARIMASRRKKDRMPSPA